MVMPENATQIECKECEESVLGIIECKFDMLHQRANFLLKCDNCGEFYTLELELPSR
jgi:uncharacterized Zn finger protein